MIDLRPPAYTVGWLIAGLGAAMLIPWAVDTVYAPEARAGFLASALATFLIGAFLVISCANTSGQRYSLQQTFMLTSGVWIILPIFGGLPFLANPQSGNVVNAYFEAMSGLTTTGATIFTDLDALSPGVKLWRGMLQWFGGVGIIVFAMVFLPELRVGGMQIFRTEGFDTLGKILPRAVAIARSVFSIYLILTLACAVAYSIAGLGFFDAVVHAMTTLATGGFSNYDDSFASLGAAAEYVGVTFMLLASLPFVRYVQLAAFDGQPLLRDPQIRGFFIVVIMLVSALVLWRALFITADFEAAFRKALFNGVSVMTGTGFASDNYMLWGSFPVALLFFAGLIGGCAGSTTCSVKVFRYQLLFAAVRAQVKRLHVPHGVFHPRYAGQRVSDEVLSSVIAFFMVFLISLAVIAVLLGMTGLDIVTSISGAVAALCNIGPGLGPVIGPAGNYAALNDAAKWILAAAMLLGRLELMAVIVLFTRQFWRG